MTPSTHILFRVAVILASIVALGAVRFSAAAGQYTEDTTCNNLPDRDCVRIFIKPTFVVKNIHPAVGKVSVWCATKIGEPDVWATVEGATQSPAYGDAAFSSVEATISGLAKVPPTLRIKKSALKQGQVLALICELMFTRNSSIGTSAKQLAVASATTPQTPTDTNWNVVAAGSVVKWTQNVSFPTATSR